MARPDTLVLCCRDDPGAGPLDPRLAPLISALLPALRGRPVEFVGAQPGKAIDGLLQAGPESGEGRLLVVGDDADLAAVTLRLLRRELLPRWQVAYLSGRRSAVTDLHSLPIGPPAVRLALHGDPDRVTVVRDDNGGVLVGRAEISPVDGTVYLDEHRLLRGRATGLVVDPDQAKGLEVTVVHRRFLAIGRSRQTALGRAVEIGSRAPMRVISDGVTRSETAQRWVFYRHTEPMRLIRGLVE